MTVFNMILNPELVSLLSYQQCSGSLLESQPSRFEHVEIGQVPFGSTFINGTMSWCSCAADSLLLLNYERANGFEALILWDLATSTEALENEREVNESYVIISSREFNVGS